MGEKRIGVAVSDPLGFLARPLTTLTRNELIDDIEAILELVRQYEAERIIVGLPRSMNGSLGQQAERVRSFIEFLSQSTLIPVEAWDERLSTVAAEKLMIESGKKRGKRKAQRDEVAAALILQGYLDRQRASGDQDE
jgi:putative Holliday junction resolvase